MRTRENRRCMEYIEDFYRIPIKIHAGSMTSYLFFAEPVSSADRPDLYTPYSAEGYI